MSELRRIVDAARSARAAGAQAVLATVVQVEGSSYRRPGARMLFRAGELPVGIVSGGCLEGDLAERAAEVLDSGESRTVVYDMRSPDDLVWGLGLGCAGRIRVLLERLDPLVGEPYLVAIERWLEGRRPGAVATVFARDDRALVLAERVAVAESGEVTLGGAAALIDGCRQTLRERASRVERLEVDRSVVDVLFEWVAPQPALVVFGAGADALPVVYMASNLGWRAHVVDQREAYAVERRFPAAAQVLCAPYTDPLAYAAVSDSHVAVLVMTHHFLHDVEILSRLIDTPARYIGMLGPHKRLENLLGELRSRGVEASPAQAERIHGPVGLDLGAETPEEIALSALAEIQAAFTGASAARLRSLRGRALHPGRP